MVLAASSRELKWKITAHEKNQIKNNSKDKKRQKKDKKLKNVNNLNHIKYRITSHQSGCLTSIHNPFLSGVVGYWCSHCNLAVAFGRGRA